MQIMINPHSANSGRKLIQQGNIIIENGRTAFGENLYSTKLHINNKYALGLTEETKCS